MPQCSPVPPPMFVSEASEHRKPDSVHSIVQDVHYILEYRSNFLKYPNGVTKINLGVHRYPKKFPSVVNSLLMNLTSSVNPLGGRNGPES